MARLGLRLSKSKFVMVYSSKLEIAEIFTRRRMRASLPAYRNGAASKVHRFLS
jgi:hypothetical protein